MFGLEKSYTCKHCGKEQSTYIGKTIEYKINDIDSDYVPVCCSECNTLHYIAEGVTIIDEDTDDAKLKAFEKVKVFYGDNEKGKNYFLKQTKFLTKDKMVICCDEVETIIKLGETCY